METLADKLTSSAKSEASIKRTFVDQNSIKKELSIDKGGNSNEFRR